MTHRLNNLDDLIINQGYMSQRTKSPRRMNQQQFFQNEMMYNNGVKPTNINKINSGRDMSPNKIVAKNKPLVSNNNINQQQQQYGYSNNTMIQGNFSNNNNSKIHINQQYNQQNIMMGNFSTLQQQHNKSSHNNNLLYPSSVNNNQQQQQQQYSTNPNWRNNAKSPRSPHEAQQQQPSNPNIRSCANHLNKKAQFMTQTDGQIIYYCQTCAAKLAAQQFEVIKLPVGNFAIGNGGNNGHATGYGQQQQQQYANVNNNTNTNLNILNKPLSTLQRRRRQIPNLPQYKNNPVYESIIQFLKQIYTVQQYHYQTHSQLEQIDKHYTQQITMVDEFYIQLMQILQKMHQDHVTDLQTQFKKHSQMKDIYINEIYQNLQTIQQIVNDLDQNFQTVVNKITNEDIQFFNQALDKNRSNIRFFCNQIQQQKDMLGEVVNYKEQRLMEMIEEFQNCLVELWAEPKGEEIKMNAIEGKRANNGGGNISGGMKNNVQHNVNNSNLNKGQNQMNMRQQQTNNNQINLNNILQPNNRQQQNNIKNQQQNKINILQIHQNQPKPSTLTREFQGKGACRQIFEDDEEENLTQQVSPKFKNI